MVYRGLHVSEIDTGLIVFESWSISLLLVRTQGNFDIGHQEQGGRGYTLLPHLANCIQHITTPRRIFTLFQKPRPRKVNDVLVESKDLVDWEETGGWGKSRWQRIFARVTSARALQPTCTHTLRSRWKTIEQPMPMKMMPRPAASSALGRPELYRLLRTSTLILSWCHGVLTPKGWGCGVVPDQRGTHCSVINAPVTHH